MYNSDSDGSLEAQSASFPGKVRPSKTPFLRTVVRAALAARLARADKSQFSIMLLASLGFFSKNSANAGPNTPSTATLASGLPSFAFVWPSN